MSYKDVGHYYNAGNSYFTETSCWMLSQYILTAFLSPSYTANSNWLSIYTYSIVNFPCYSFHTSHPLPPPPPHVHKSVLYTDPASRWRRSQVLLWLLVSRHGMRCGMWEEAHHSWAQRRKRRGPTGSCLYHRTLLTGEMCPQTCLQLSPSSQQVLFSWGWQNLLRKSSEVQTRLGLRFVPFPGLSSSGDEVFGERSCCDLSPPHRSVIKT